MELLAHLLRELKGIATGISRVLPSNCQASLEVRSFMHTVFGVLL